ncbi:TIGR04211 family SH3 domain-containing protein [Paraferrimonas haliotis]|uniref:SH3 domain protein n=1 Tax=Paraferrimonas haliotis TaxID=2013866 RepID=A0AA37TRQ5_9GAMM|nr:TIGR04211 family SH3 domain-containing protein [Paraferrimonas haliotis]GLS83206.1 SH3 domain protein [Paraferrimonas haliotis]
MKLTRKTALALMFIGSASLTSMSAVAADAYISDNVYVYLQAGPSNQYRILGTIETGQKITLLNETQNDYVKIRDHKGREGWLPSEYVSNSESFRYQVSNANSAKEAADAKAQQAQQALNELQTVKSDLDSELSQTKAELAKTKRSLAAALESQQVAEKALADVRNDEEFAMWREGGMIAGVGIILGLIIAYLPKPRKRSGANPWM